MISCNNSSSSPSNAKEAPAGSASSGNSQPAAGDAYVSYTIDAKAVMIKGDKLYLNKVSNNTTGGIVHIEITNFSANPAEVLKIVAHNSGATTITNLGGIGDFSSDNPSASIMINNSNHYANEATVNITKINGDYAEGSFSGKFTGDKGMQDQTQETVTITDGKFHLPFKNE